MSDARQFVHLHVHTEYSLLDGLSRIDQILARARELDMPALAITDHGAMFGVIEFFRAAREAGIKPIIGMEAYLARRTMQDRDPQLDSRPYHLLLLARDQIGYHNLLKIASVSQLEGYYYRPRVDRDFLAAHAEGLIATSGCLAAEIPRLFETGKEDETRQLIGWYQDVFGPEHFYLELQQHDIPQLAVLNKWLVENSKYARVPLVATNDVHYVLAEDYDPHDTLLCIQTSSVKNDPDRLRMTDASYHLRSPAEMWDLFGDVPEALTNTLKIAEACEVDLEYEGYHLPVFPVPEGYAARSYLRYLCEKGRHWRYGGHADDPEIVERLNYELDVIHDMGFDTYFLIVWDLCEYARHADIWWNVRGSGAGSVAAYCLGVTNIDPLQNGLIFERFLNPGRVSMPDIDLDYPDDRRAEVIEYAVRKYGEDKVAAIITFGTMGSKAAIRDVGRALDMPLTEVDRVARMLPSGAKPVKFNDALGDDSAKAVPELKQAYDMDPYVRGLVDVARKLEGVVRHASTHAAGVIIADKPLDEYIPLHRPTKGEKSEDVPVSRVTQFDMDTCESIGLLKIDFLGLATLTIMRKACELIEQHHGIRYNMDNIPYRPDPKDPEKTRMVREAFELIGRGETVGIFQIESAGMRRMLTEMRPRSFENIIAAISLYRPGPMDYIPQYNRRLHGQEQPTYKHPKLAPILEETYGIITYQEQILQIAAELFGYSLGDADLMRRAVSKKKEQDLLEHRAIFVERGPAYGIDTESAATIFDDIATFANYGFNKSHAADYGVITCQTAFLKAHYPVEYMTALLSVQRDDTAKVATFTAECRRMGIPVLPPDLNRSGLDFSIEALPDGQRGIRYGLAAVKNAGVGPLECVIRAREEGGPFEDLGDFCRRVDLRQVQKRALESLIKVGALHDFGTRLQLLGALDRMLSHSARHHEAQQVGQLSLFGETTGIVFDDTEQLLGNLPDLPEVDARETRRWEKELVGHYVSSHPLDAVMAFIQNPYSNVSQSQEIKDEAETLTGRQVVVVGVVDGVRPIVTKKGDMMGILTLEDLQGQIELVLFPRTWEQYRDEVHVEDIIRASGRVDMRRGEAQVIVESILDDFTVPTVAAGPQPALAALNRLPDWLDDTPPVDEADGEDGLDAPMEGPLAALPEEALSPPPEPFVAPATAGAAPNAPDRVPQVVEPSLAPPLEQGESSAQVSAPGVPPPARTGSAKNGGLVLVTFRRSDDAARDRRRLGRIHGLLVSYPGRDRFRIVLRGGEHDVEIDFPNHTTGYSEGLLADLHTMPDVEVGWLPGNGG